MATKWSLTVHDGNVHQKCKPHACRVCNKMFGEKFNRNKVRSTLVTGARAHASRVDPWCCGPSPRQRRRVKAKGEVKTGPISNISSMALVWLAYICWGASCVHFFRAQHEGNLHPDFNPDAYERGLRDPSGGGRASAGGGNNGGPYVGVAIGVGFVGGPDRGVPFNGPALPQPYPAHSGALWV